MFRTDSILLVLIFLHIVSCIYYGYDKTRGTNDDPALAPLGGIARYVDYLDGENSGGGDIDNPWLDLNYAIRNCESGDTIYLRDSKVHDYNVNIYGTNYCSPVEIRSYPGEWAIFDGTGSTSYLFYMDDVDNVEVRNLEVRNNGFDGFRVGLAVDNSRHVKIDNVYVHHNHGPGVRLTGSKFTVVTNSTSAYNFDYAAGYLGQNGDGFGQHSPSEHAEWNRYYRCVAMYNSDDGFDTWIGGNAYFEDCISFSNGKGENGNGNGFKLGGGQSNDGNHTCVRCVSMNNKKRGFDENGATRASRLYNCLAFNNTYKNFNINNRVWTIKNTISLWNANNDFGSSVITTSLSDNLGDDVTIDDFESVDFRDLNNEKVGERFFFPKETAANLIDQGSDIPGGYVYRGDAFDISPREWYFVNESEIIDNKNTTRNNTNNDPIPTGGGFDVVAVLLVSFFIIFVVALLLFVVIIILIVVYWSFIKKKVKEVPNRFSVIMKMDRSVQPSKPLPKAPKKKKDIESEDSKELNDVNEMLKEEEGKKEVNYRKVDEELMGKIKKLKGRIVEKNEVSVLSKSLKKLEKNINERKELLETLNL